MKFTLLLAGIAAVVCAGEIIDISIEGAQEKGDIDSNSLVLTR
jgi:hypothetical protein